MTTPHVGRTLLVAIAVLAPVAAVGTWATNEWEAGRQHSSSSVDSTSSPTPEPKGAASLLTKVRVRPDGVLRVHQWIRSSVPLTGMVVAAPVDPYLEMGTVTASQLEVEAGGVLVPGVDRVTLDSAVFAFEEARTVQLRYLLSGALERTAGSTRALARVTSLDIFLGPSLMPTTYVFSGAHILNLACSQAASSNPPEACGAQEGDKWVVRIAEPGAELNRVMVQLDLVPQVADRAAGSPRGP